MRPCLISSTYPASATKSQYLKIIALVEAYHLILTPVSLSLPLSPQLAVS